VKLICLSEVALSALGGLKLMHTYKGESIVLARCEYCFLFNHLLHGQPWARLPADKCKSLWALQLPTHVSNNNWSLP
jgi:hypothetical protein